MENYEFIVATDILTGKRINVSNKKMILWGAGETARWFATEHNIKHIEYVLSGCSEEVGMHITLNNRIYRISSPQMLSQIVDNESYYIVIASIYIDEIKQTLALTDNKFIATRYIDFKRAYCSLEGMFCYNRQIEAAVDLSVFDKMEIKNKFFSVLNTCGLYKDGLFYEVIRSNPRNIVVRIIDSDDVKNDYIIKAQLSSLNSDADRYAYECSQLIRRYLNVENSLYVYEDLDCISIAHYSTKAINLKDQNSKKQIAALAHKLHQSGLVAPIRKCILEELYLAVDDLSTRDESVNEILEICKKILRISQRNCANINKTVIHGDLSFCNMISWKEDVVFIDWERIKICNPLMDIAWIIASMEKDNGYDLSVIEDWLIMYYGRNFPRIYIHYVYYLMLCWEIYQMIHIRKSTIENEKVIRGEKLKRIRKYFYAIDGAFTL